MYVGDAYLVNRCRRNDTEAASRELFVKRMEEREIYRGNKDMKGTPFIGYKLKVTTYIPPAVSREVIGEPEISLLPVSNARLLRTFLDEHGFIFEDEPKEPEVLFD